MRLSTLRRSRAASLPGITAVARVDRRVPHLARRALAGEIAVVDCVDLDRASAKALVDAGVVAVVNAAPSISGRYRNLGPRYLVDAGVVLVDDVGGQVMTAVADGSEVRVDGATVYAGEEVVGTGVLHDRRTVEQAMEDAKRGIPTQFEAVSATAAEQVRREVGLFVDGAGVPLLATPVKGRHLLVVAKAFDYRGDLASLKPYLRENTPVLVGVDAGADALLESGRRPDVVVVSDAEAVSEAALRCGAEVVAKASPEGRVTHGDRLERLGVRHATFSTSCSAEDAALLVARANSAALTVTAGMPGTLDEVLDRGRSATASALLTRMCVGSQVADARSVAELYRSRVHGWLIALLVLLALAAVAAALYTTPVGHDWWDSVRDWFVTAYDDVRGQVS